MDLTGARAILGVDETASLQDIKAAYRSRVKYFHPDAQSGNSADGFVEFKDAYDILRNSLQSTQQGQPVKGGDIHVSITLTLEQIFTGGMFSLPEKVGLACERCDGTGKTSTGLREPCPVCEGVGIIMKSHGLIMLRTRCPSCDGQGSIPVKQCPDCSGTGQVGESLSGKINIPAGIPDNSVLSFPGRGHAGQGGAPSGSLHVRVEVLPHPRFHRDNLDLQTSVQVSFADLCLGGTVRASTLSGGTASFRIPAASKVGDKFPLKGLGLKHADAAGRLVVALTLKIPRALSLEQVKLLEQWRTLEQT